jgi:DNA-binding XRE family transcriptional regulator
MNKTFKKTLKQWRTDRGFVQKEAAAFLGVSKRTYEGWEYGRTCPKELAMAELTRRMNSK